MDLICKVKFCEQEYICELTNQIDKFLVYKDASIYTYIYKEPFKDGSYAIRCFGATRGNIRLDKDNKILSIVLDTQSINGEISCYKQGVLDNLDKYLGYTLIFK